MKFNISNTIYFHIKKNTSKNNVCTAIPYQNETKHTLGGTGMSQEVICVGVAYHHIVRACCSPSLPSHCYTKMWISECSVTLSY